MMVMLASIWSCTSSFATLVFYDSIGGGYDDLANLNGQSASPDVGSYLNDWSSVTGSTNIRQYRINESQGLTYTDANGTSLVTSGGSIELVRHSGSFSGDQTAHRQPGGSVAAPGETDVYYFSGLLNMSSAHPMARMGIYSGTDNFGPRITEVGFTNDGAAHIWSENTIVASTAAGAFTMGETYFFVFKVEDDVDPDNLPSDQVTLWINPILSSEAANPTPTLQTLVGFNGIFPNNTEFDRLNLVGNPQDPGSTYFDEFRIGGSWDSITPIPEPGTLLLVGISLSALLLFRRKK